MINLLQDLETQRVSKTTTNTYDGNVLLCKTLANFVGVEAQEVINYAESIVKDALELQKQEALKQPSTTNKVSCEEFYENKKAKAFSTYSLLKGKFALANLENIAKHYELKTKSYAINKKYRVDNIELSGFNGLLLLQLKDEFNFVEVKDGKIQSDKDYYEIDKVECKSGKTIEYGWMIRLAIVK